MRHQLLTKEIVNKLPKLRATEGNDKAPIIVKFFMPSGNWTYYATEGEPNGENFIDPYTGKEAPDYEFFGMVHGHEKELGYFVLSDLCSARGAFGLRIERDMHFGNHTLADVQEKTI